MNIEKNIKRLTLLETALACVTAHDETYVNPQLGATAQALAHEIEILRDRIREEISKNCGLRLVPLADLEKGSEDLEV